MAEVVQSFGAPDILINNVGRALPRYFEDVTFEQFDETMKTNLYGAWNTISVLVPHMKAGGGTIVNVSSMAGFIGVFGYTDYCASKFAVVGLSEALRQELRRYGITVAVLCPPDTDTPGLANEDARQAGGDEGGLRRRQAHAAGRRRPGADQRHRARDLHDRPRRRGQARLVHEAAPARRGRHDHAAGHPAGAEVRRQPCASRGER